MSWCGCVLSLLALSVYPNRCSICSTFVEAHCAWTDVDPMIRHAVLVQGRVDVVQDREEGEDIRKVELREGGAVHQPEGAQDNIDLEVQLS